ncbi:MAG: eukaryotic-like serine/threonine-protein kinase [Candidatus Sumerlaeota bacterium]|nr:eukaryotic-like serine/threonine-protein kinase [Candidatus Sumerlaeota bacterium]
MANDSGTPDSTGPSGTSGEFPTREVSISEFEALHFTGKAGFGSSGMKSTRSLAEQELPSSREYKRPLMQGDIPLPGDEVCGNYRYVLEERLGAGAYGSVYRARCLDREPGNMAAPPETVALKIFHMPDRTKVGKLIRRELQPLLMLDHPRIPKVYDWVVQGPVVFVVMEYYASGSISDVRSYYGNMPEEQGWQLLTDLLSALKSAHSATLLHLDIKPQNVLVDANGSFVLSDFGIAQGVLVPWNLAPPGLGTQGYRSPEQQEVIDKLGEVDERTTFDMRTDLWGVGSTVWAVFTGLNPSAKVVDLYKREPGSLWALPRLSQVRPDCSQEFEQVVMSLLGTKPEDRPGSAAEVLATIRRLRGEGELNAREYGSLLGSPLNDEERLRLAGALLDPVWIQLCRQPQFARHLVRFQDGDYLIEERDSSYLAYVLLQGKLVVERGGVDIASVQHEGAFMGEIATLTGRVRTASVRAEGETICGVFNASELERIVVCNPAVGLRLIKTLAKRFADERLGEERRE